MGAKTEIAWTDATFNPWWGCQRVSPGCEHCYAETFSKRVGLKVWGPTNERRFFGDKHWREPLKWNRDAERAGVRRRVFCASMADVFEDRRDLDAERARLRVVIDETPHLDWLLLTKRPENVARLWVRPLQSNIWLGTTCEDAQRAEARIPHLLDVPAAVRFISYEPALGPIDFVDVIGRAALDLDKLGAADVDWIIVGGESGHGARPFDVSWARSTVEQCRAAGVACFVKQLGANVWHNGISGPGQHWPAVDRRSPNMLDGHVGWRIHLHDAKGGDWSEWPEDLRVRQWPQSPLLAPRGKAQP